MNTFVILNLLNVMCADNTSTLDRCIRADVHLVGFAAASWRDPNLFYRDFNIRLGRFDALIT